MGLTLTVLPDRLAVCRLDAGDPIPAWAARGPLVSITRTREELSLTCPESDVPEGVRAERGFVPLKLEGPFDFALTGILVSVASPLAEARISLFAISTFDTDYVLVKGERLGDAVVALRAAGHEVKTA
jgi:hypothetical protein